MSQILQLIVFVLANLWVTLLIYHLPRHETAFDILNHVYYIEPKQQPSINDLMNLLIVLLYCASIVIYWRLQYTDPGYLTARSHLKSFKPLNSTLSCFKCNLESIPMGARHCRVCDRCVRGFDHHCWMADRCIGSNNYSVFFKFVWVEVWLVGYSAILIGTNNQFIMEQFGLIVISAYVVTFIALVYFLSWLAFLAPLHLYLWLSGNRRTHQLWKPSHRRR